MKTLFTALTLSLALLSTMAFAQKNTALIAHTFENQWEKPVELNAQTKWVVLSQSKDGGKMVQQAFDELKMADLDAMSMVYIADISRMPGFVTKLFAIPKMKDYAFPIALIKEEGQIAELKMDGYDTDRVTVLQLDNLTIVENSEYVDPDKFMLKLKQMTAK